MSRIEQIMLAAPVIPVLVIDELDHALPIAEALVAGGLPVLEVTLRTEPALEAIRLMKQVPGAIVGAGTVLNAAQLDDAAAAGAEFIVSPGLTEPLGTAALASGIPYLPGIANSADIMRGLDLGLDRFKFFPAEALGGLPTLSAYASVFRQARFCPTGGVTLENAAQYLALDAVLCVGGSWVVPKGPPDRNKIEAAARAARSLAS